MNGGLAKSSLASYRKVKSDERNNNDIFDDLAGFKIFLEGPSKVSICGGNVTIFAVDGVLDRILL